MDQPRPGIHYPRSTGEFQAWFRTGADCLDYLEWLRWPGGFICPSCGHAGGWRLGDGRHECAACHGRTSVTAGTIFDRTRTPLTVWFTACWLFATQKDGISAQSLQRSLEIGSYPTAWAMLHRLRSVLVRPGRDRLSGIVQVDETFIGGDEPGLRGGRAPGKKVLTGIAVEVGEPKGIGRCRMAVLADGSAESLHPFVTGAVEPGATVITDAGHAASRHADRVTVPGSPGRAGGAAGVAGGPAGRHHRQITGDDRVLDEERADGGGHPRAGRLLLTAGEEGRCANGHRRREDACGQHPGGGGTGPGAATAAGWSTSRPSGGMAMAISRPVSAASTMASPSECIRCFSARRATASWRQASQPAMWVRTRSRSESLSSPSMSAEMRCPR